MRELTIPPRFNGPRNSGNGGVSAGLVAALLGPEQTVTVTLRKPPPLATLMRVAAQDDEVSVYDGTELVAEARVENMTADPVEPVSFDEAAEASLAFVGFHAHLFPTCFGCGPDRSDGLFLFPGPTAPGRTATPFVPREPISPELMWAALDCPGGWTIDITERPAVLGRMAAFISSIPAIGEQCVVVGALDGRDGRKAFTRTTAYGADGRELGRAAAIWIEIPA